MTYHVFNTSFWNTFTYLEEAFQVAKEALQYHADHIEESCNAGKVRIVEAPWDCKDPGAEGKVVAIARLVTVSYEEWQVVDMREDAP